jgi:hypothetical protein
MEGLQGLERGRVSGYRAACVAGTGCGVWVWPSVTWGPAAAEQRAVVAGGDRLRPASAAQLRDTLRHTHRSW